MQDRSTDLKRLHDTRLPRIWTDLNLIDLIEILPQRSMGIMPKRQ